MNKEAHRTLLVDDCLDSIEPVLAGAGNFELIARAYSASEALSLMQRLQPDLVLLDFTIPDMNVLEVIRRIKSQKQAPCVVILSQHYDRRYQNAVLQADADGFVSRDHFDNAVLARIDRLLPKPFRSSGTQFGRSKLNREPETGLLSAVTAIAWIVIALSCLIGASFTSWHYWQEEHRAQQRELDQQRQRFLDHWGANPRAFAALPTRLWK